MNNSFTVGRLTREHELKIRRLLMRHGDAEFALHRQLSDYFLTESAMFGGHGVWDDAVLRNVVLWSRYGPTTFVHYMVNGVLLEDVIAAAGGYPAEAFVKSPDVLLEPWTPVLHVTPGFVVNHPAYEGVFSRVAPRFEGTVYHHE